MVFDASGGFWLVHSVPRFPFARNSSEPYTYPAYAKTYGQSFICLSLSTPDQHSNNSNLRKQSLTSCAVSQAWATSRRWLRACC